MRPRRYKAKDLNGKWVTGWYAELHIAETDLNSEDHDSA